MRHFSYSRILLVEDEVLIGLEVADVLREVGYAVVGPYRSVADALNSIARERPAAAVLDVNLGAETSIPIADALDANAVPFLWLSGYPSSVLPERHNQRPLVGKPFATATLLDALASASSLTRGAHRAA